MGLKLSALQSEHRQKNKALAAKMYVFAAFTHAKLYFLRASQEPGYCNTTNILLKLKIIVLANFTFQKLD